MTVCGDHVSGASGDVAPSRGRSAKRHQLRIPARGCQPLNLTIPSTVLCCEREAPLVSVCNCTACTRKSTGVPGHEKVRDKLRWHPFGMGGHATFLSHCIDFRLARVVSIASRWKTSKNTYTSNTAVQTQGPSFLNLPALHSTCRQMALACLHQERLTQSTVPPLPGTAARVRRITPPCPWLLLSCGA